MRGWVLIVAAAGCYNVNDPDGEDAVGQADGERPSIDSRGPLADAGVPLADAVTTEVRIDQVEDTFLHLANPTFNQGGNVRFCGDLDDTRVALLRFDLSSIPGGTTVSAAALHVFTSNVAASDAAVDPYNVHEVLEPWVEGTLVGAAGQASWNQRSPATAWTTAGANPPGSRSTAVAGSFTPATVDTEFTVPLDAALVQRWVTTPEQNRGIAIVATTNDGACFIASEGVETAKRPSLRVTIVVP